MFLPDQIQSGFFIHKYLSINEIIFMLHPQLSGGVCRGVAITGGYGGTYSYRAINLNEDNGFKLPSKP